METIESAAPGAGLDNLPIFTVGEISQSVKGALEGAFARVRVRGEISGFKRAGSGHLYFSLKDADAVLDAVCWRGTAGRLAIAPDDGVEVIATGRITSYPQRSRYQIVVEALELSGEGALLKLLEERRAKLGREGLFDADRKKPLPFLPDVIGVVTSPTGAVIRDILHRIGERFPRRVLVWPVLVQGDAAAAQIAAAIAGFNALPAGGAAPRPDLLIVARGGGSLEDLWAFNEEAVVRAVAESRIPVISAVGHETDTTLIDYAADHRAPTPSAAAEAAVPVRLELLAQVIELGTRVLATVRRTLAERAMRLEGLARGLPDLARVIEESAQRLDDWTERLTNGLEVGLERRRARLGALAAGLVDPRARLARARDRLEAESRALAAAARSLLRDARSRLGRVSDLLESASFERVLERGFALVSERGGAPIATAAETAPGMDIAIRFSDAEAAATVTGSQVAPAERQRPRRAGRKDTRQGELL
ncbi:MAG TPA: exodeoxyribonuclease VII large subunit [Rhodospirillales bacterium]|jgi:exodeoxyribonuclease VII large subunit|nr:exodeoxyribonuclease VII large subunit [Rhodospirillales bacterium]HJO69826.1 exodeoxyribonuclease VII large subunit [Rhodospirillales bacterium]